MGMTSNVGGHSDDTETRRRADVGLQADVLSRITTFAGDVSVTGVR